jgi:hypothetical protein
MIPLLLSALFLSACFSFPAHAQDVARVGPKKIVAKVGQAFLAWETKLGALSAGEFWSVASHSIDRACVKSRS